MIQKKKTFMSEEFYSIENIVTAFVAYNNIIIIAKLQYVEISSKIC